MDLPAGLSAPPSTILPALRWAEEVLRKGRIDEARLTSELLMCHVLGCARINLYLEFEKILLPREVDAYVAFLRRRLAHEPLQYITGETSFMGLRIAVDTRALIPRPETEILVESALAFCRDRGRAALRVLDVGIGTGNIAIAVAHFHHSATVVGVDVSRDALALARSNVREHDLDRRVSLVRADVLRDPVPFPAGKFDLILSNPPYIPSADIPGLDPEIRLYEPELATTDGGDGLAFYRRLARLAPDLLAEGGALMVETGYNQARAVGAMFIGASLGGLSVVNDLSGVERVVIARR
jgi:release factor glutamine methyltransferase